MTTFDQEAIKHRQMLTTTITSLAKITTQLFSKFLVSYI